MLGVDKWMGVVGGSREPRDIDDMLSRILS